MNFHWVNHDFLPFPHLLYFVLPKNFKGREIDVESVGNAENFIHFKE